MLGYIKGKVLYSSDGTVLLENNGIGYEVLCSGAAYAKLISDGQGEVYTYLQVREDGVSLFGFVSLEEKNMFLKLISVSGVGPKMGITVLSSMNINDIAVAIANSDVKKLTAAKGLGKKTAERIILELREKVSAEGLSEKGAAAPEQPAEKISDKEEDAVVGLMSLGYTRAESVRAVKRAEESGAESMEEIIMTALRTM
ncbi:MAG TPA: Holliday junction branch migration protein RuvA [Candidatus Borkfalkia stercoripullorum]|uniref:Holliday junction branch migration complex subunit RuvA n=1 Tax=Candidatus Borkfalkia avistercoris TaxID=2838504 RepID=A0A9D2CZT5_9FIRM|nr:Holliday junction branch migration protein RuvA [Candidatus Borkfalkia avistercoris]HJB93909.1 Holliday junction branch migration protein RuvA [Candidatus Borkfalkia stercoripullorum]